MRHDRNQRHRLSPQRRILIVCGGTRTERQYFEGLMKARRNPMVEVKLLSKGVAPDQLVRHAKRVGEGYDELWCVVDTDEFDIAKAARMADELGVRLVVSNPCFELWLLLHFADHRGAARSYQELRPMLIKHVPGYDKCRLEFNQFGAGVEDAAGRAERLDPSGQDHDRNPSTGVWKLVRQVLPG